ncbi:MAG TPA: hypothetical protein VHC43_14585 [Mycobacteriales bacterium]|nr:hypothetical protein [Mycobacteriales bacterium]
MRRALHAEWTKLRTVPAPAGLALAVVVLTVGVGALVAATVHAGGGGQQDPVHLGLMGLDAGQAAAAALGVLVMAGEYANGMVRTTLVAIPRRLVVLASKATLLTGIVAVAATVGVLASLLAARLLLPGGGFTAAHGFALVSLGHSTTLRAAVGSVLYLVLIGWLGLGVAAAVRDTAAATGTVLGVLYLFPMLSAAVSDPHWHRHLDQISPMTGGQLITATTDLPSLSLTPWQGLGVLAAWALGALIVGGAVLKLRDA